MTILVKYCGGCNSRYDRAAFVEKLRKDFPSPRFLYAGGGSEEADIVLVICGCPAQCASHEALRGRYAKFIVASEEEYGGLREKIREAPGGAMR